MNNDNQYLGYDPGHPNGDKQVEVVQLECLYCHTMVTVKANGLEMQGVTNVFCHDKDCEDDFAWKEMFGSKCFRCNDNGCPACDGTKGSPYNPEPY